MNRISKIAPLFVLGLGLGCAGAAQEGAGNAQGGPTSTQQRITNINAVDLGVCFPKAPAIGDKVNDDVLTGLLVAARPVVMECLVDPKNRGPADETSLSVKSTLAGGKLAHVIAGQNTTPAGEACIRGAIDKYVATIPDWEKKAAASGNAKAEVQYKHIAGAMPTVKMGVSEGSDVAGTIRLAESTFCDCYGNFKEAEPATLKATVKTTKAGAPVVTIEPAQDPKANEVAACLSPKVAALPFKTTSDELTTPFSFMFLNSSYDGMFANATPELNFAQYELVRNQKLAATAVGMGSRTVAAMAYDGLVQQYQKDPKTVTPAQLIDSCAALVKTDDDYIAMLEGQLALEQKALEMLTSLAAKDANWTAVKDGTAANVEQTKKDIEAGKKYKAADQGACPKMK